MNLSLLVRQLKSLNDILAAYGEEVEALVVAPRYREPVKTLTCYKGIKHLFALTMITEIGDVKRFAHPRQLVSWAGMDIREYASGGKSHRFGITRQGNHYLRTTFIEANQRGNLRGAFVVRYTPVFTDPPKALQIRATGCEERIQPLTRAHLLGTEIKVQLRCEAGVG